MTVSTPSWWTLTLLALAAYRLWRIVAKDTITEPLRAMIGMADDTAFTLSEIVEFSGEKMPKSRLVYLTTLVRCPWCVGFYLSVVVWALWDIEPRWATFLAAPLAISAIVGLVAKLDQ